MLFVSRGTSEKALWTRRKRQHYTIPCELNLSWIISSLSTWIRYFESTKFILKAAWLWKQFYGPSTWAKTLVCPYSVLPFFFFYYFWIPNNTLCLPPPHPPPKWEDCSILHFLRSCEKNNLSQIWGTNRVYYGGWGRSKIVNGFFASKGPAHGKRKMRGIMFVSSLESRGDGAGRDNKFSFPFSPAHPRRLYFHGDRHMGWFWSWWKLIGKVQSVTRVCRELS